VFYRSIAGAGLMCFLAASLLLGQGDSSGKTFALQAAANSSHSQSFTIPLTLQKGTALSIALDRRVPIGRVGEPVQGTLVQPVYAFDRIVAPAGTKVLGHVAAVNTASRKERAQAIMGGNFTPLRSAQVEFDTLVLGNGRHLPIQTRVSPATAEVVHLSVAGQQQGNKHSVVSRAVGNARRQIKREKNQMIAEVRRPGRTHRLKEWLISQLPYHRQFLSAGTRFTAALENPISLGSARVAASELKSVGTTPPADSVIEAVLVTPLSSATAHHGTHVEAIVTRPVFSNGHGLIIPEGSELEGEVVQAKPAGRMRLHRNGILRFTFQKIQAPHGVPHLVEGSLQGVVVDKKEKLKLDPEGGAHSTTSKMDYAAPAIAVLIAAAAAAPDVDVRPDGRVYTDTNGPAGGQILGGGLGYKLVGMGIALGMHYQPVTAGFAAYGAARSVYSHLLSRGQDVVFPEDTPMEIRLGERRSPPPGQAQPKLHRTRS
jgi:type IV secretory pathway VirB10-like protein